MSECGGGNTHYLNLIRGATSYPSINGAHGYIISFDSNYGGVDCLMLVYFPLLMEGREFIVLDL